MTTVDQALGQQGDPGALPPPPLPPPRGTLGRLTVTERAARHLVQGVAQHAPLRTSDVGVRITDMDDAGLSAEVRLAAEYPHTDLATAVEAFRRHVSDDVNRLLGRPLRRLDVIIDDLLVDRAPTRRVQ